MEAAIAHKKEMFRKLRQQNQELDMDIEDNTIKIAQRYVDGMLMLIIVVSYLFIV